MLRQILHKLSNYKFYVNCWNLPIILSTMVDDFHEIKHEYNRIMMNYILH
jgi:hypothetical protein